jgi:hypothetical protein
MLDVQDRLIQSLNKDTRQSTTNDLWTTDVRHLPLDDNCDVYIKTMRNPRSMTLRELEDHLIELKRKRMNTSGIISKLLTKYCTECLDGERTMAAPVRDTFMKRIAELETIYFDKNQTTGFPSLGVIAILIDYCKCQYECFIDEQCVFVFRRRFSCRTQSR